VNDAELLDALTATALEAGEAICRIYDAGFDVRAKADDSPVTAADHASEAVILGRLRALAPEVPVIAEEETAAGRVPRIGEVFFLVDPLDGTKEFVQRRGDFTVNVALVRDGSPALGVVYAPARQLLFAGDTGARGAWRADRVPPRAGASFGRQPIHVRKPPASGPVAVASRSHSSPETDAYLARQGVTSTLSIGSSLKFCLVASAEADLYPRFGPTMEWDTAAGHAVLVAAGGHVMALDGTPLRYGKPGFRNPGFLASGALAPTAPAKSAERVGE
jgi:3'(2'), 5'-bisphosphate nucleotidase